MRNALLDSARRQAQRADPSVHAAALLRIARAESVGQVSEARRTLLEALDSIQKLPTLSRSHLPEEARYVTAGVAPDLLAELPATNSVVHEQRVSVRIVQTMLAYGHTDAAFDYLLRYEDPASFPFLSVRGVLHHLDRQRPESAERRLTLLRRTLKIWRKSPSGRHSRQRRLLSPEVLTQLDHFVQLFGTFWKEFPPKEALAAARMVVKRAAEAPDTGTSADYEDEFHFSSPRQYVLFNVLHVLRHLDPALADSLIHSHDQLASAARRYPNGQETMEEEVKAEVERRKADCATSEGASLVLMGEDLDRQRRLIIAARDGNFGPSMDDALEKYREDTSPVTRNYAPKEYWPSTGTFRTTLYRAGKHLGLEAAKFLEQIPDEDLRLFATIELAAALGGVPESWITHMKQPAPRSSLEPRRVVKTRS